MELTFEVNGQGTSVEVSGHEAAVDVVREQLGLTGAKLSCGGGVCGACTIQVDGTPVASCLTPATALEGAEVTTVEGIAAEDNLHPIQKAFLHHDGLQCGYCTPGFIVDAVAFHDQWRAENDTSDPGRGAIADALAGHLCRCAAYEGIYRAVGAACRGEFDGDEYTIERVDGPAKVTGAARYTTDQYPEGALEAVIIRSKVPAGDVAPFEEGPLVVDLLGEDRRVRWVGQPIAVIGAETLAEARQAAEEFPLGITELPFVLDPDEALTDDAPLVYEGRKARRGAVSSAEAMTTPGRWHGNRRGPLGLGLFGGVAQRRVRHAREENDPGLVEIEFETGAQLHCSLEPHCTVADFSDPERLEVWTSTQALSAVAKALGEHYHLEEHHVVVNAEFVGGGFGSKLSVEVAQIDITAACDLSRKAGRPVRLIQDRRTELTATGNRAATRSKVSLLANPDGELQATLFDGQSLGGVSISGVYGNMALQVYGRHPRHSDDIDIVTNAPPGTAFRGPGGPVANMPLESAVDQVAHNRGEDPIALRQRWDGNERRQALYERALGLDLWHSRPVTGSQTGRFRRGVGAAMANWMYMSDPTTEIKVMVENGGLVATTASQDPGTGSKSVVARAVAGVFDLDPTEVEVRMGVADGDIPHGPTSGGSRSTASLWPCAVDAAEELKADIGPDISAAHDGKSATARRGGDHDHMPIPAMGDLRIGRGMSGALHIAEVEVDTLTGKIRVLTVDGSFTIGVPHAPVLIRSQAEGGIMQAIGLALYENQILDPHTGTTLTSNMEDYRVPQLGDTPEITIHFHEPGWEHVRGGGVGIGEVSTIGTGSAVCNAVFNATGWRPTAAPIRPDRVLEGLR